MQRHRHQEFIRFLNTIEKTVPTKASTQAIEAVPKDGSPVFLVDKDTGDMTATHWAVVQRLF